MRFLLIFIWLMQSASASVLVRAPGSSRLDYQAALKADPEVVSPSQAALQARPLPAHREALLATFAAAQEAFLDHSPEVAIHKFISVTALLTTEDWGVSDRRVLLHAFLRLAQLRPAEQGQWLNKALGCGDDVEADADLFPPPLLRDFKKWRARIPRVAITPGEDWEIVLLNGFVCDKRCLGQPLNGEKVRVTYLSDTWKPTTQILLPNEIHDWRPEQIALAGGTCAQPETTLKDAKVFFDLDCENPKPLVLRPVEAQPELPRLEIKDSSPAFYKSKWFWGGLAIATVTALIVNGQKRKDANDREPTTTYGAQGFSP